MTRPVENCPQPDEPMRDRAYTDRQLLELAAKAAGVRYDGYDEDSGCDIWFVPELSRYAEWNPLADDGDALRLQVACNLIVKVRCNAMDCYPQGYGRQKVTEFFGHHPDRHEQYAATRRAIVRAAAAIAEGAKS